MSFRGLKTVYQREIRNYFNTPIGYVFGIAALLINFSFFFLGVFNVVPAFWEAGEATIRGYMYLLPVTFILMVPAVSMRLWSEEKKQGTFELLMTLPLTDLELVLAKFLAAWTFVSGLILAAVPLTISIALMGRMDYGTTVTLFLGAILMAGAYVSMGMLLSALTREQVVAFILIFAASLFMFLTNYFVISRHMDPVVARFVGFFSHSYHFSSFASGVIHPGDIIYYLSFMGLMIAGNIRILRRER